MQVLVRAHNFSKIVHNFSKLTQFFIQIHENAHAHTNTHITPPTPSHTHAGASTSTQFYIQTPQNAKYVCKCSGNYSRHSHFTAPKRCNRPYNGCNNRHVHNSSCCNGNHSRYSHFTTHHFTTHSHFGNGLYTLCNRRLSCNSCCNCGYGYASSRENCLVPPLCSWCCCCSTCGGGSVSFCCE